MTQNDVILRPMQLRDISYSMQLSAAEGWNQTENDWRLFIENPLNIGLVAEAGKKVIGTATAINYSNEVGWIGMVLVDKSYRGKGVGKLLLNSILEKSGHCKSVKLDATPAGQPVYKKLGFVEEYFITRMTNSCVKHLQHMDEAILPEPIQLKNIGEIIVFDKQKFGADRRQLIEYLVSKYPGQSWLIKRNNQLAGYALGREGNRYYHIGPVMAETMDDAKILISKALYGLINQPVVVDILQDKEDLQNWFTSIGFSGLRQFVRMYKNENSFPGIVAKQYLICGPEFG